MMKMGKQISVLVAGTFGIVAIGSFVASPPTSAARAPSGDPVKGKVVFGKCAACHSIEPGQNRMGPNLAGIVGRKAGSVANYAYSPAMKANAKPWDRALLDAYLANPRAAIPGNKMYFVGLPQQADRDDLIAYLTTAAAAK